MICSARARAWEAVASSQSMAVSCMGPAVRISSSSWAIKILEARSPEGPPRATTFPTEAKKTSEWSWHTCPMRLEFSLAAWTSSWSRSRSSPRSIAAATVLAMIQSCDSLVPSMPLLPAPSAPVPPIPEALAPPVASFRSGLAWTSATNRRTASSRLRRALAVIVTVCCDCCFVSFLDEIPWMLEFIVIELVRSSEDVLLLLLLSPSSPLDLGLGETSFSAAPLWPESFIVASSFVLVGSKP
mmetsp:Transcript_12299/g.28831  ORF Transcript_12299/g.28831 Transcript_12299/m.28831 type:complete len:242 (+) Transcript_12299:4320-5045(+)